MKKIHTNWRALVPALLFVCPSLHAQLYTYDNAEDGSVGTVATGVAATSISCVNGTVEINACPAGFNTDTWSTSTGSFNTTLTAVQFTLTPDPGTEMTITSMSFDLQRNPQGPQRMRYAYSTNGGLSWVNNGSDYSVPSNNCNEGVTFVWDMTDFTATSAVLFRVYGWNANNSNGKQQVSNGVISGTACTPETFYADADGDGYGDALSTTSACTAPTGYVADNTDCDDLHDTAYPGATEVCDGIDNDCNALIDENVVTAAIYPATDQFTCKSDPLEFSTDECVGCTYQWFKNDNVIVGATNSTYSTTKPAYYSVQVNLPEGCFAVSDHRLLTTLLNPNANIYNPNGLNLCAPSPGTNIIVKVGYTATNTYQWYHNDAPYMGEGGDSWRIFPSEPGDYYCSITASSGCNRVTEIRTVVGDCKMGETEVASALSLSPNPASSEFVLQMNLDASVPDAQIVIMNSTGEIVYSSVADVYNGELYETMSLNMPSGIYLVQVNAAGKMYSESLILNK